MNNIKHLSHREKGRYLVGAISILIFWPIFALSPNSGDVTIPYVLFMCRQVRLPSFVQFKVDYRPKYHFII